MQRICLNLMMANSLLTMENAPTSVLGRLNQRKRWQHIKVVNTIESPELRCWILLNFNVYIAWKHLVWMQLHF